jgi:membrane-bound lytic murein transglycosylase D
MRQMFQKLVLACAILAFGSAGVDGVNAESLDLEDLLNDFDPSVLTNLDVPPLPDLSPEDAAKLQTWAREWQSRLQGEYTLKLAPVRSAATAILPALEQNTDTQPLAKWLRAGLPLITTADEMRVSIPPPEFELPRPPPLPAETPLRLNRPEWPQQPSRANWPASARPFVPELKRIFVEEGVPSELIWVAEVESGFAPRARSRTGAVGLYQLMPDTAELLGLSVKPVDERLSPAKNARAAAQYLKYLYDKFGDWRLAVAAYNGGEGRVWRLLEQSPSRNYDSIAARLPPETQYYVTKVEAAVLRREGVALAELPTRVTE